MRDIEATLAEALGPDATVSKSTVSRVCQAIKDELDAFTRRSLADIELEYLFLDASHFKYHKDAKAEPVLLAWGITTTGKPVLLHLAPDGSESTEAWAGLLCEMKKRGLGPRCSSSRTGRPASGPPVTSSSTRPASNSAPSIGPATWVPACPSTPSPR